MHVHWYNVSSRSIGYLSIYKFQIGVCSMPTKTQFVGIGGGGVYVCAEHELTKDTGSKYPFLSSTIRIPWTSAIV